MTRVVLLVVAIGLALTGCGGSGGPEPAWNAARPVVPAPPPDAGIPEGHALADARRHRCRSEHPPRFWGECARIAR